MKLHRDVRWLSSLPLFHDFTEEQLQLMAFNCRHRAYENGQYLFKKDEQAMSAFVIISGNVELVDEGGDEGGEKDGGDGGGEKDGGQGKSHGTVGPGTVLGDVAMIVRTQRLTSARAIDTVEAMEIPRSVFHRVLEEFPEIAERIRRAMAERIGAFVTDLKSVHKYFEDEEA